jgi:hypothetical protein
MREASTNKQTCPQESAVSTAVRTGEWAGSLRTHAAECESCGEIVDAARWMQDFAGTSARDAECESAMPDPSVVWWRARMAAKQREAERVHKMLAWLEVAAGAAISLGLAGWLALDRNVLPAATTWMMNEAGPDFWTTVNSIGILTPLVFSSVVVDISLVAISLAYFVLARD